jgi:hypothetical protein
MSIDESHHALNKHIGLNFVKFTQNRSVHFIDETCNNLVHSVLGDSGQVGLGKLRLTVEILLIFRFVKFIHGSETSP